MLIKKVTGFISKFIILISLFLLFLFTPLIYKDTNAQLREPKNPSGCSCSGAIFCTGPCDVVWYSPYNCGCSAALCDYYDVPCTEAACVAGSCSACSSGSSWCPSGGTYDPYESPPCNIQICGGVACVGTCPAFIDPCINICGGGGPTSTPVPTSPPPGVCGGLAAPSGPNTSNLTATSVTLNWTHGSGGTTQLLMMGPDLNEVKAGCPGGVGAPPRCIVSTSLASSTSTYNTGSVLIPGTTYYWRVVEFLDINNWYDFLGNCTLASAIPLDTSLVSCTIDGFVPNPVNIPVGGTQTVTINVTALNGPIDRVDFVMVNPAIATLAPASDATLPYQTVVTGVSPGATEVRATVIMNGVVMCGGANPVDPVNVTNPVGWWQVINGDVITNASLDSQIPPITVCFLPACDPVFSTTPAGGNPGIPSFGGTYDFLAGAGLGTVSSTNWLARASYSASTNYDYDFFDRLVPGDVVRSGDNTITAASLTSNYLKTQGSTSPDGYKWYFRTGDLTLNGPKTKLNNRKVVLFVDGNLTINETIDVDPGDGFFMAIVSGNTTVNSISAPGGEAELEGIFVSDGNFVSMADTEQLWVRGMVSAYGQAQLARSLADNSQTPAELFEYAPEVLFQMPQSFNLKRTRWKEVSP